MNKIKCPYCGAEYLPSEIYIPSDFLPKFEDLTKDESGKIVAVYEKTMNTNEEYTCDYCGHRFAIVAEVNFNTDKCELHDYKFDYNTPLYSNERTELPEN